MSGRDYYSLAELSIQTAGVFSKTAVAISKPMVVITKNDRDCENIGCDSQNMVSTVVLRKSSGHESKTFCRDDSNNVRDV